MGRWVVVASFVALLVAPLSLSFPTAGLFVLPVTEAFGWNRATFFLGPSIGAFAGALLAPFIGAMADRWGTWRVLSVGVTIYALSVAGLGLMQGSVVTYLALSVLLYGAGQVQTSAIYSKVVSSWFNRTRGIMIALATSGLALGGVLSPLIARRMMSDFGWRHTYFALGAIIATIALPPILLIIRERPEPTAPASACAAVIGLTMREAAATRTYWTVVAFFFFAPFAMTGLVANIVPMLTTRGVPLEHAVLAVSTVALTQSLGRLISGLLLDRVRVPQIALIWFVGCGAGLTLIYFAHSTVPAVIAAGLIGLAWGTEGEISGYYVSRYFGLLHFARIAGSLFTALGAGAAASQMWVAWLVDRTGGYGIATVIAVGAMTIACALLLSLKPYVFLATHGED